MPRKAAKAEIATITATRSMRDPRQAGELAHRGDRDAGDAPASSRLCER